MGRLSLMSRPTLKPGPHAFAFCRNVDTVTFALVRFALRPNHDAVAFPPNVKRCYFAPMGQMRTYFGARCTNDSHGHRPFARTHCRVHTDISGRGECHAVTRVNAQVWTRLHVYRQTIYQTVVCSGKVTKD